VKRVLVTGATGLIGRNSLPVLLRTGYEVHAVSGSPKTQDADGAIHWHCANLLRPDEVVALVQKVKPSHLFHLAWYAIPGKFWTASENLDWVQATVALMRVFRDQGGQRFVGAGSCAEYDWTFDHCQEASTPCRPATLYGAAKYSTQLLLDAWSRQTGTSSAWGRVFFLYGPGEYPSRLVPSVINSLLNGEPALCTHGEQVRDFMHVEDVAAAFVALLDSDVQGVVNIASGAPLPLKDVIYTIADQLGRRELVQLGAIPANAADPAALIADIGRLRDEVGFRPRYSLKNGIALTVESMKISKLFQHE
jgi:nucleoside-diphosphate-sugar epimerase